MPPGMLSRCLAQHRSFQLEVSQLLLVLLHQSLGRHAMCMLLPQLLLFTTTNKSVQHFGRRLLNVCSPRYGPACLIYRKVTLICV